MPKSAFEAQFDPKQMKALFSKLRPTALMGPPIRRFLNRSSLRVTHGAQRRAPRFTGVLQRSIVPLVDPRNPPLWARIGTKLNYARAVHGDFDTRARRTRPHWPPITGPKGAGLRAWARSKGMPVGAVAAAIAKRGTPLVPFLTDALRDAKRFIHDEIRRAERDIARRFSK